MIQENGTQLYKKMFYELNIGLFNNTLKIPEINIISSSRIYVHYKPQLDIFQNRQINISSQTLYISPEDRIGLFVHALTHMYNDTVLNIQDNSRAGTYHNKEFKATAEAHGLICTKTKKHGWANTKASKMLLEWLKNNTKSDIIMNSTKTEHSSAYWQ